MQKLFNGDCVTTIREMKSESVDLVLTDPPYNLGKFMQDRDTNLNKLRENFFVAAGWDNFDPDVWEASLDLFFSEVVRVLKHGASVIIFMAIIKVETVVKIAQKHGLYYKTTGIWHKQNPMPRNMNLHFINSTEAWIYFTYGKRTGTFNNNGEAIHDFIETSLTPMHERRFGKHPTQKPLKLMEHFVALLSNAGDMVLDPFMGSGASGVAAIKQGRNFTGIELDKTYFSIAKDRISAFTGGEE